MAKHRRIAVGDVVKYGDALVKVTAVTDNGDEYTFRGANHEDAWDIRPFVGDARDAELVEYGV